MGNVGNIYGLPRFGRFLQKVLRGGMKEGKMRRKLLCNKNLFVLDVVHQSTENRFIFSLLMRLERKYCS